MHAVSLSQATINIIIDSAYCFVFEEWTDIEGNSSFFVTVGPLVVHVIHLHQTYLSISVCAALLYAIIIYYGLDNTCSGEFLGSLNSSLFDASIVMVGITGRPMLLDCTGQHT